MEFGSPEERARLARRISAHWLRFHLSEGRVAVRSPFAPPFPLSAVSHPSRSSFAPY